MYADLQWLGQPFWYSTAFAANKHGIKLSKRRVRRAHQTEALSWQITFRGDEGLVFAVQEFLSYLYDTEGQRGLPDFFGARD